MTGAPEAGASVILEARGLVKRFGAVAATNGFSIAVGQGTFHALIGPNGAGKTTAIAQLSGELSCDEGTVHFDGRDVTRLPVERRARLGIARSYQITSLFLNATALENVALAVESRTRPGLHLWSGRARDTATHERASACLERSGLGERAGAVAGELAHGEQRQLEIAMALAIEPKLLILDEPMAGMGKDETLRLAEIIRPLKGATTLLLVEHDMDVVFALADRVTVMVDGRAIRTGTPAEVRADPLVREAYLGAGA
jgi:branched-chain amino acid transport system ATP-binding protein